MRIYVHDNWVYAQTVDHEQCRIILHTFYPHIDPPEYTDVVFEGVVVHHFEQQRVGGGPLHPANVLFDIEEVDPKYILNQYAELFSRTRKYGWPVWKYDGIEDLILRLTEHGAKCFDVHGTFGIHGFVFAASIEFRPRDSRAEVSS